MNIFKKRTSPKIEASTEVRCVANTFQLRQYQQGDNLDVAFPKDGYSVVFVLAGRANIIFQGAAREIKAEELLVFQNETLQSFQVKEGTTLIVHYPPQEVADNLAVCVKTFSAPSSQPLPISDSLANWLDELRAELISQQGTVCSEDWERQLEENMISTKFGEVHIAYLSAFKRFLKSV